MFEKIALLYTPSSKGHCTYLPPLGCSFMLFFGSSFPASFDWAIGRSSLGFLDMLSEGVWGNWLCQFLVRFALQYLTRHEG